jgi:hypothetical protein
MNKPETKVRMPRGRMLPPARIKKSTTTARSGKSGTTPARKGAKRAAGTVPAFRGKAEADKSSAPRRPVKHLYMGVPNSAKL